MKTKIVFVTSHPIQYQVPVFRHLASMAELDFEVFFAMIPGESEQGAGFGISFEWDIPILEGYRYRVLDNRARVPGVTHFKGCDTPGVSDAIREARPDAVVVNGWVVKSCLQALWACRRAGIPCLVRGEANDLRQRPFWKRLLQRGLVSQYAACLYIGEANKLFYQARHVPGRRLFPSPYCVENERLAEQAHQLQPRRDSLREEWGIAPDVTCFLFCGKLELKKHPLELLASLRLALQKGGKLHLLMVGDGELRSACEEFVRQHDLPVTFAGFLNQSRISEAYVASDCLVLPSDAGETWGLVTNEAMACGKGAIVSDQVGCAADLVSPDETGHVFDFGDWQALADRMHHCATDPVALQAMGVSARERVFAYSPQAAAEGICDGVLWAAGRTESARE
ncbi:MAG: glycosyltransferase family 4 protein [Gammaproteobacteria bacterium]|nr:glycosyltransferase family 4 protein [Gammaproteobacteria bacterium]